MTYKLDTQSKQECLQKPLSIIGAKYVSKEDSANVVCIGNPLCERVPHLNGSPMFIRMDFSSSLTKLFLPNVKICKSLHVYKFKGITVPKYLVGLQTALKFATHLLPTLNQGVG